MKYLPLILLLLVSCRVMSDGYFWYYDIQLRSDHVEATYRLQDGSYKTERVFNGWIYGWGTESNTTRYYIKLVNKSEFGGNMLVRLIKVPYNSNDRDTVDIAAGDTVVKLPR